MDRFFYACAWTVALCVLPLANVANGQSVTIREINPTRSDTGGNAATGGRVNNLARATDTIFYAASEFGGLYKSNDAGRTWVRLDAHLPTRVSDVEASPEDPDILIATSLYDGRVNSLAGINFSTNGGTTWIKPASANPPTGFCASLTNFNEPSAFGIAFNPENAAQIFVGTNCGLARSTNGGTSWTFLNPGPGANATNVFDVVVHHGGIIDTCGSGGHRRSTDGGGSWTGPQTGGTPLPAGNCSIAASPDESYVLIATAGTRIFETDNAGGSWNTQFVNPAPQGRVPFVVTNKRQGRNFDLWFGDVTLFRAGCTTPASPAPGGAVRCPASNTWAGVIGAAHFDLGDVVFTNPPRFNVTTCRQGCTNDRTSCQSECVAFRNDCLAEVGQPGGPLASACVQAFTRCRTACTNSFNACDTNCNRPQEGCPIVMSSDGGTFFNTVGQSPACQTPSWSQPNVTPRSLWLFSLGGANIPSSITRESLYMGAQDNGTFATQNAGATTPAWTNPNCCDSTDTVSDGGQVLFSLCCFNIAPTNRLIKSNPGLGSQSEIPTYPPGTVPRGTFPEVIATFGTNRYAVITSNGIFATQNITTNPITWTSLGTNAPTTACALWAAGPATSPTFYALTGFCSGSFPATLMRYNGTSATGTWQNVPLPAGSLGVGVFTVDPKNPNRLFASSFDNAGVRMFRSSNGGTAWVPDTVLDGLMNGGGAFRMRTSNYAQPTMVAFDPNDANNLLAGAADAGIFLSRNNGASWTAVTNNSGNSANPVIPRPYWTYFDRECSQYSMFVGTQGRGAWRLSFPDPAGISVSACQARCEVPFPECQSECVAFRNDCLAEVGQPGGPLASACVQAFVACRAQCSNTRNACRQRCLDCPQ
jgi:hypothetical protein